MGSPDKEPTIWHMMQQLAWVDDDVHEILKTDAKGARPKAPSSWKLSFTEDASYIYYTDEWGITRRRQKEGGYYFDLFSSPLANAETPKDIERYPFPDPVDESRFEGLREFAERVRKEGRSSWEASAPACWKWVLGLGGSKTFSATYTRTEHLPKRSAKKNFGTKNAVLGESAIYCRRFG